MGMGFAPTWLRHESPTPLLHKTTLTTGCTVIWATNQLGDRRLGENVTGRHILVNWATTLEECFKMHMWAEMSISIPCVFMVSSRCIIPHLYTTHVFKKPSPYDVLEQLHNNRPVINGFRQNGSTFSYLLIVRYDMGREPLAQSASLNIAVS